MTHAEPARAAGEPPVGDQRDMLAHILPVNRGGGGEHFAHARTAFWSFITNHQHVALFIRPRLHGGETILLAVETKRRAGETLLLQPRHFHDRGIRRQIAFQPDHAAGLRNRAGHRIHHVLVDRKHNILQIFRQRAPRHRQAVAMQQPGIQQRLQHHRDAADVEHVQRHVFAARLQVRNVRRAPHDRRDVIQREAQPCLMRHRRQMQRSVGGTARGAHHHGGVLKRPQRTDVARPDILFDEIHHRLA